MIKLADSFSNLNTIYFYRHELMEIHINCGGPNAVCIDIPQSLFVQHFGTTLLAQHCWPILLGPQISCLHRLRLNTKLMSTLWKHCYSLNDNTAPWKQNHKANSLAFPLDIKEYYSLTYRILKAKNCLCPVSSDDLLNLNLGLAW